MEIEIVKVHTNSEDSYTAASYDIVADGKTVGGVSVMTDSSYTYCDRIDVSEEFRGQGIGTAALKALSEEFDSLVIAPDNEDAQRLYARLGSEWGGEAAPYIDQGYGVYEI